MTRRLPIARAVLGLSVALTLPAAAQVTLGADAAFNSNYNWRGLSLSNKFVIQPDLYVSLYGFTGGVWANVEPSKCTGSNDLCETGGARSGVAEIDYWLEYGRSFGDVSAKLGWVAYTYNKDNAGISDIYNTSEVYGNVSMGGLPVTPSLGVWYDIDNVKGFYFQPQVTYGISAIEKFPITLGALVGFSAGQEVNSKDSTQGYNFAKRGISHADLSANGSYALGPVTLVPVLHYQISVDPFTKINGADPANQDKGSKVWFGLTASWSMSFGSGNE